MMAMLCTAFALAALASPKAKKPPSSEKSRKHGSSRQSAAEKKRAAAEAKRASDAGTTVPRSVGGDAGASLGGVKESKQTDAGSSYKFGELEIEGRLKTPQIVYFLRRVRAEFAAQDLGHRSFTGELKETRKEPSF